jgi:formate dehydrogenase assembly factor FdhD
MSDRTLILFWVGMVIGCLAVIAWMMPADTSCTCPATEQCQQVMQQSVPLFTIFLDPELLDALTEAAKKAYRTPELHAAYLIDKGVRGS